MDSKSFGRGSYQVSRPTKYHPRRVPDRPRASTLTMTRPIADIASARVDSDLPVRLVQRLFSAELLEQRDALQRKRVHPSRTPKYRNRVSNPP
ncbi:hypothetical protein CTheo_7638 [Ceratobasidium theobromae]|uniref:Uncharacterized protein n=1 Tax=Ceratobasidium theobromae TaxID=1582974 RepID=A0A5N5QAZ9_9AGAM|nr:hypothetical protein CTheo_7638 [Ceratobasidium theobromae]